MTSGPLDPDYDGADAACLMVGRFFLHWALLENNIHGVIRNLFKLGSIENDIITTNMRFTDKLSIVHTALQWQGPSADEKWRRNCRKLIARIGRLNRSRNLIAHNLFMPLKNKTVRFYKIEAKGDLAYPDIRWSKTDFERTFKLIEGAADSLQSLTKELHNRRRIIEALMAADSPLTKGGLLGPALAGHQTPQPQSLPGSRPLPAIPETNPQNQKEPGAKG